MSPFALSMTIAFSPAAWAFEVGDTSVSLSDDFRLRYYRDATTLPDFPENDHLFDYVEQVNRLNLLVTRGDTDLGLQVDEVWLFADRYYLDDVLTYEHQLIGEGLRSPSPSSYVSAEKVWLTQRMGDVTVQVGDGYMSLGRGLALNLVKNTDIDIDTSVLGAQASAAVGDWDLDVATGLTNQQQVQQENPNVAMRADLRSAVHGVGVTRYGLGPANIGVHGAAYSIARETTGFFQSWSQYGEPMDVMVGGATVELLGLLGLDLFGEFDYFHHTCDPEGGATSEGCASDLFGGEASEPGRALYGSITAYAGPVTLLAEVKDYINTERINSLVSAEGFEFASGPTLEYERVITEDSSATVNSNDVTGGRVRADIAAVPGKVTPYVSVAAFRDRDLAGLHFNETIETIVHPVAGLDLFGEHINTLINAGYRVDIRDPYPPEGPDFPANYDFGSDRLMHADVDFRFPVGERFHGEAIVDVQRFWWGENAIQQHDFTQGSLTLSMGSDGPLIYTLFLDYSNNPLISTTGNLDFFSGEGALSEFPPYAAGELVYKVSGSTTVKGFYGAYRAGIRCSGGQCRNLPGFNGARLTVSTAF